MTTETKTPNPPSPNNGDAPKGSDTPPSPEYKGAPLPGKTFTDSNGNTRTDH